MVLRFDLFNLLKLELLVFPHLNLVYLCSLPIRFRVFTETNHYALSSINTFSESISLVVNHRRIKLWENKEGRKTNMRNGMRQVIVLKKFNETRERKQNIVNLYIGELARILPPPPKKRKFLFHNESKFRENVNFLSKFHLKTICPLPRDTMYLFLPIQDLR